MVDRLVALAVGGVDLELPEQRVHAEGPGLVGDDGHDPGAELLVPGQVPQQAGEGHGGGRLLLAGAGGELVEGLVARELQRAPFPDEPAGHRAVQGLAPVHHVAVLDGVLGRPEVRRGVVVEGVLGDLVVEVEAVPQRLQLGHGHLLDLVGGVAALDVGAQRPALDGLGQDHRRGAGLLGGRLVGGVELAVVVPAPGQVADVVVGQVRRPAPAGGGRARRSAPGRRPRPRRRSAGTRRRRSRSSC